MSAVKINSDNNVEIDDIKIDGSVFEKYHIEYSVRDRDDLIDDLIMWIHECKNSDKQLMKDDLKYLMNIEDEYVFSSTSTNEYIAKSDNAEAFQTICDNIISENKTNES